MKKEIIYLYYDIMREIWPYYHKWILHWGKYNIFQSCGHMNPFYVLTPRLFKKQVKEANKNYEKI